MPAPGFFNLYPAVVPGITAGNYKLRLTEDVQFKKGGETGTGNVEAYEPRLRVTSARYHMPPDQILSTFPPANAEGAFGARLPQVVLKRRTLPWERVPGPPLAGHTEREPWLALVVLAEGEAKLSTEVEIAECVTPGKTLTGPADVPRGLYLEVTDSIVKKVFPSREDLPLLVHVREVDKSDTELALGDDDGWMAVVMANRFPQPSVTQTEGGSVTSPTRYLACLINLEQQLDALPPADPDVDDFFIAADKVFDYRGQYLATFGPPEPDTYAMSASRFGRPVNPLTGLAMTDAEAEAAGLTITSRVTDAQLTAKVEPLSATWQVAAAAGSLARAKTGLGEEPYIAVRDAMSAGWRFPIDAIARLETRYRFPVLAHWSFTTTDGATFEELMLGLDVGLLGTLPAEEDVPEGAPPPPPRPRPLPEVTETGHVGLDHLIRRGDRTAAWYRGPLSPHVTERDTAREDGSFPVAHASDHLRRVTPDGREDLSYAAAFEIGRLLALSQPSVVAAQLRWRAEQYGAERAKRLASGAFGDVLGGIADHVHARDLGRFLGGRLVDELAVRPGDLLGPRRPVVDPGRPIADLGTGQLDTVLARGLGLDLARIREQAAQVGVVGAVAAHPLPVANLDQGPVLSGAHLNQLRLAAELDVGRAAALAVSGVAAETARQPDALDDLLGDLS